MSTTAPSALTPPLAGNAPVSQIGANVMTVATGERSMGKDTSDGRVHPTRDEIETLAYQLYERGGRQPGRDRDDWLAAEQQLTHHYGGRTHGRGD